MMLALLLLPVAGESLAQAAPTTVELSLNTVSVENLKYVGENATTIITVTAVYSLGSTTLTTASAVEVSVAAGTAQAADFTAVANFTVTIAAGALTGMGTFTLTTLLILMWKASGKTVTASGR